MSFTRILKFKISAMGLIISTLANGSFFNINKISRTNISSFEDFIKDLEKQKVLKKANIDEIDHCGHCIGCDN